MGGVIPTSAGDRRLYNYSPSLQPDLATRTRASDLQASSFALFLSVLALHAQAKYNESMTDAAWLAYGLVLSTHLRLHADRRTRTQLAVQTAL